MFSHVSRRTPRFNGRNISVIFANLGFASARTTVMSSVAEAVGNCSPARNITLDFFS